MDKLEQYSTVARDYPSVAALLKSSHVKDPRGEFLSLNPLAEPCVKYMRVARNGIKAAAKEVFRSFVPPSADASPLIDAVMSGVLIRTGACSVSSLADPSKAKTWLGVPAASANTSGQAGQRGNLLVVQLKALPLLAYALMVLQPEDQTVAMTMMEVMASFSRGVSVRSVTEVIDGLLVPLMRAYADAFDRFQKSSSAELPHLADVWAAERKAPTILAFLSMVGTAEAGQVAPSAPAGDASEVKALKSRWERIEKKQKGLAKQLSDVESDGDEEESEAAKKAQKAAKKARKKAKKQGATPVDSSAAPGAAAAAAAGAGAGQ